MTELNLPKLDLLADTTYRSEAMKQLDKLLQTCSRFPVKDAQIYGLRQIARQQPDRVAAFAQHQRTRAEARNSSGHGQSEIDFWNLVHDLCNGSAAGRNWSLAQEAEKSLPLALTVPAKQSQMTLEERTRRNQIKRKHDDWHKQWQQEHIPVFFERFCTHCLYRASISKPS